MVIRYLLALIIVLAGLTWAMIWMLSAFKEARGAKWKLFEKMPVIVAAAWLTTGAYALGYYIYAMIVGGTPMTRLAHDGTYWLIWDGKSKEVGRELYLRDEIGEAALMLLLVGSLFISWKFLPNPPNRSPKSTP